MSLFINLNIGASTLLRNLDALRSPECLGDGLMPGTSTPGPGHGGEILRAQGPCTDPKPKVGMWVQYHSIPAVV